MRKILYLALLALLDIFIILFVLGSPQHIAFYIGGGMLFLSLVTSLAVILSKPKQQDYNELPKVK